MTEVKNLLDVASGAARPSTDPAEDLARAQKASRARAAKRLKSGTVGLALVAVAAVGLGQVVTDSAGHDSVATNADVKTVSLVAEPFVAAPYTFGLTPKGWKVETQAPDHVTIVPVDGSASSDPSVFTGKLVILFDQNPPSGTEVTDNGREFWISSGDSGYMTVSTNTRGNQPPGMVRIQYPTKAGWTRAAMLKFLGSVHVGEEALPGLG